MAWESKLQKKSLWTAPVEKSMFSKERVSRKRDDGTVNTLQKTPIGLTQGHNFNLLNLKPSVQAKLTVGAPGDKYEQEADNMASQVMSMPDSAVQRMAPEKQTEDDEVRTKPLAANITPLVQREEIPQEEEENKVQPKIDTSIQREVSPDEDELQPKPLLQRATDGSFQAGANIESQLNNSKGGGSPLGDEVRAFMEPRFGADFSSVRVHTGDEAVQMNRELGAQAFTHGRDVYFGAGKAPGNNELTAHELTHVVQQTGMIQLHPAEAPLKVLLKAGQKLLNKTQKTISKHVAKHGRRISGKAKHTIFRKPEQIKNLVSRSIQEAKDIAVKYKGNADQVVEEGGIRIFREPGSTPGKYRYIIQKEFNKAIGSKGEKILHIVLDMTGRIVTAYPKETFMAIGLAAGASNIFDEKTAEASEKIRDSVEKEDNNVDWISLIIDLLNPLSGGSLNEGEDLTVDIDQIVEQTTIDVIQEIEEAEKRSLDQEQRDAIRDLVKTALGTVL